MRLVLALAFLVLVAGCESTSQTNGTSPRAQSTGTVATGSRIAH